MLINATYILLRNQGKGSGSKGLVLCVCMRESGRDRHTELRGVTGLHLT